MKIHFRPLPGLTISCALLIAFLIGLGVWQLQRLQWKLGLIAEVTGHLSDPPVTVDQALAMGANAQYHRVTMRGIFDHAEENYIFTTDANGAPVYHVLTPFFLDGSAKGSHWLMVDRGMVPKDRLDPRTRKPGNISGETQVTGVWRVPDPPGPFTPAPEAAHRLWFSRNVTAMAVTDGITLKAPILVEADAAPNPGGWPKGGQTVVTFRNEHLSYAITWFGLAAGLLGVYLAFHMSRGRLKFEP